MVEKDRIDSIDRRAFMKTTAAAVAGPTVLAGGEGAARVGDDGLDHRNERRDSMQYRQLGKTKFMASRLAFGCGAALAGGKAVHLLDHAFEAGINHNRIERSRIKNCVAQALVVALAGLVNFIRE